MTLDPNLLALPGNQELGRVETRDHKRPGQNPARDTRETFRSVEISGPTSPESERCQYVALPTQIDIVPAPPEYHQAKRERGPASHGQDAAEFETHQHHR